MNDLLAKLSSYNIFNYLVPGALFCIALRFMGVVRLPTDDIATLLLTYYVVGMVLGRLGSLIVGRGARRFRRGPKNSYGDYVRAAAADPKVDVLLESANTYRSMTAAFACLAMVQVVQLAPAVRRVDARWLWLAGFAALTLLFLLSYVRQIGYVDRRVQVDQARRGSAAAPPDPATEDLR